MILLKLEKRYLIFPESIQMNQYYLFHRSNLVITENNNTVSEYRKEWMYQNRFPQREQGKLL